MRHRISGKQLCRDSEHRRAMLRNLAAGLFEHGQIETTRPKAKAVQPYVEKIITRAKQGTFSARRHIANDLTDRRIHAWVADSNVPDKRKSNPYFDLPDSSEIEFNRFGELRKAPRLVHHIMTKIAPLFADRDGGYTRIIRTGRNRLGDGTDIVILQLVGEEEGPEIGGGISTRRQQADKRAAFAAKLNGPDKKKSASSKQDEAAAPPANNAAEDSEAQVATATATAEPEGDAGPGNEQSQEKQA